MLYVTPYQQEQLDHCQTAARHPLFCQLIKTLPGNLVKLYPVFSPLFFYTRSSAFLQPLISPPSSNDLELSIVHFFPASCSAGDSQLEHKTRLQSTGSHRLSSPAAKFTLTGEITASWRGMAPNREARSMRVQQLSLVGPMSVLQLGRWLILKHLMGYKAKSSLVV